MLQLCLEIAETHCTVLYWSQKLLKTSVATDGSERNGPRLENVGLTFSSFTVLVGGKYQKPLIVVFSHLRERIYAFLSSKVYFVDQ